MGLSLGCVVSCARDKLESKWWLKEMRLSLRVWSACAKDNRERERCAKGRELSSGCGQEASEGQKRGEQAEAERKSVL